MTGWTVGPWRRAPDKSGRIYASNAGAESQIVATVGMRASTREREANATLIAAAPDLYTALSDLLQYIDDHDWGLIPEGVTGDRARAALAKARGDQPDSAPPIPTSATSG